MTTTQSGAVAQPRTYGNWRRARGIGIGKLSTTQTLVLFGALLVPVLILQVSSTAALVVGGVSVLVILGVLVRLGGQSGVDVVLRGVRFGRARRRGWTELSAGLLTDHPRGHDLPGPMAPLVPLSAEDGRGGRQGLLWDRRTGWLTVVLRVSPVGLDLADQSQADAWVAGWGAFLADLGFQPLIRHLAVTVDTVPSGGTTVGDYVTSRLDPAAPAAARAVMTELAAAAPATSSDVDTRVSITFDPLRANPRPDDLLAAVAEVTRWLPGLEIGLSMAGVSVRGRASAEWLIARLRSAYDPAARGEAGRHVDEPAAYREVAGGALTAQEVLRWSEAGPLRANETWESWRHDSGTSVSWALAEAPRQAVVARVLTPLLAPGPFSRRVTLLYQAFPADKAADEVERQVTSSAVRTSFAQRTRRDETQRDRDDRSRAIQAAREEAEGAGVVKVCLYVSTTVADEVQLPAATADVEQRAGQAKLRLRRMRGAQAAGFAAALGLGINPIDLARKAGR